MGELVPGPPAQLLDPAATYERERHPVLTYLARLRPSGRRTQAAALDTLARALSGGRVGALELPWYLLRYPHTAALRSWLAETYQVGTARTYLSESPPGRPVGEDDAHGRPRGELAYGGRGAQSGREHLGQPISPLCYELVRLAMAKVTPAGRSLLMTAKPCEANSSLRPLQRGKGRTPPLPQNRRDA